jgi:23S rRNA (guanine745-N1)-methyltransferase
MLPEAVSLLACPHCGGGFAPAGGSLRCLQGHTFDVARHGYLNLVVAGTHTGTADTAAMVAARDMFLRAGHFAKLRDAIAEAAVRAITDGPGCIIDIGTGTGYYLAGVLTELPGRVGLALDLSKFTLRRAARAHERIGAVACDAWGRLPVRDGCAALILDIFAPRNSAEFRRVLAPGGRLIVVTPTSRHLQELVAPLGLLGVDDRKQQRLSDKLGADFALASSFDLEGPLSLAPEEVATLVGMGPSSRHIDAHVVRESIERVCAPWANATLSVTVSTYRPV